jgi:ATP-binding cassette, subfamily B, multidrug efflux pump
MSLRPGAQGGNDSGGNGHLPGGNGARPPAGGNGARPPAGAHRAPGAHGGTGGRPGAFPGGGPGMRPGGRGPGGPGGHMMGMMLPPAKANDFRGSFRRLLDRLTPERPLIALVVVLAIISVAFAVTGPKILGNATNDIFSGLLSKQIPAGVTQDQIVAALRAQGKDQLADMLGSMHLTPGQGVDFTALGQVLLLLIGIYLLSSLFSWMQAWIMAGVTQRTVYRLRQDVDVKLGRLPLKYFDSHPRGDILSRVTNDIDNIGQTLQQSLTQLITSLLTIVGVLILMLTISWELAAISILAVPASIVLTIFIAKRSQKQFVAQWASTGTLNGHIEEMHTGHAIVKLFGRQEEAIQTFDAENHRLYDASYRAQFISGIIQPAMNFISNLNYVAIAVIGGVRVATGQMSLGDVIAFIQYSRQFTFPIVQTASIANVLQSAVASAERVFELLDEPEEIADPAEPLRLPSTRGAVAFDDISFRYEPDVPLIDDLSLVADAGHTIAIVGPTGAGKTTLVNLLMRFYELDGGKITIDGIDTRDLARDELRRTFGMVLQDAWLFHGTIRDNIAYSRDDATEAEIEAAATAAHVDHFVHTLPDGYDTVIDDDATNLSAGEKQLLTIARAFLADPAILILDEATSSVDTRTEVLIQRAMARLMKGRTAFVIAHRLSTIRDADTILVMNRGAIVEQGNHEELLAKGGFYAELYNSQFSGALAEAV